MSIAFFCIFLAFSRKNTKNPPHEGAGKPKLYLLSSLAILSDCFPPHGGYIFDFSFRTAKTMPMPSMANKASPPRILSRCHCRRDKTEVKSK